MKKCINNEQKVACSRTNCQIQVREEVRVEFLNKYKKLRGKCFTVSFFSILSIALGKCS